MFKTVSSIKKFLLWAKENKIKKIDLGELKIEFSDLAFIDDIAKQNAAPITEVLHSSEKELQKEDEDLLFWSSTPGK